MIDVLQNRSDQCQNRLSEELASSWIQSHRPPHLKDQNPPQATVSPRVMGHAIHKPRISLPRLDLSALNNRGVASVILPQQANGGLPDQDDRVDTTEAQVVEEAEEDVEVIQLSRRRRNRPNIPPPPMGTLEENQEEEEIETGREEMVLLLPRVVLDRIRVTPSRQSSRRTSTTTPTPTLTNNDLQPPPPPAAQNTNSETPRARESFDDFTRRLGAIDPMEGPSWMFEDLQNPGPSTSRGSIKPREEKRQETSLKARLSSASRRLSMEENDEEDDEEDQSQQPPKSKVRKTSETSETAETQDTQENPNAEEPRRRGGRAAAQAARSSLKEQPINTKLRQGDPSSSSVYGDFVPGTKRKSDRNSTNAKNPKNKRKKSDDKKKRDS